MLVQATSRGALETEADTVAFGLLEGDEHAAEALPSPAAALVHSGEARTEAGRVALAHDGTRRILLVGLGKEGELDGERARVAAASAQVRAADVRTKVLCWQLPPGAGAQVAEGLVQGTMLRAYKFARFKREERSDGIEQLIVSADYALDGVVREAELICSAQNRARELANAPANVMTPTALAEYARELAAEHQQLTVEVMDEEEIRAAGMGAFAAVAQGSRQGARLILLRYGAATTEAPHLGLVGKAVTFDAGGLSLKPAAKMHEMKFDMAGGAAVIETIAALGRLDARVNVLGLVGATENLPGGSAVKPGDIVTALDGTTIEVNNTDAEGRLVMADLIALARRERCERLVDIATLTGGIVTALGSEYAGLMANDEQLAATALRCATLTGERLWRLPLDPRYAKMVKGRYAQLTNHTERREASPITAAEFLHHFAGDVPWAHIDIAGTGYDVPREYFAGKGATGFGVRLLVELARELAR